jgi:hypothetical protein
MPDSMIKLRFVNGEFEVKIQKYEDDKSFSFNDLINLGCDMKHFLIS